MLNTNKMVNQLDKNGDGIITYEEWVEFWECLLNNGYNDESIIEEVNTFYFNYKVT